MRAQVRCRKHSSEIHGIKHIIMFVIAVTVTSAATRRLRARRQQLLDELSEVEEDLGVDDYAAQQLLKGQGNHGAKATGWQCLHVLAKRCIDGAAQRDPANWLRRRSAWLSSE